MPHVQPHVLEAAARNAGAILVKHFKNLKNLTVERKADAQNSPVTIADREAEAVIQEHLLKHYPNIPFIGEETHKEAKALNANDPFFLVDACDGTKSFIKGYDEWTVNIALIVNQRPRMGVVYAPITNEMFVGTANMLNAQYNGQPLKVTPNGQCVSGIAGYTKRVQNETLKNVFAAFNIEYPENVQRLASSLRLCRIAQSKADVYPQLFCANGWDIAAAEAVVNAAGGLVCDFAGKPVLYGNQGEGFVVPPVQVLRRKEFKCDLTALGL